jgi:hypothetical protein
MDDQVLLLSRIGERYRSSGDCQVRSKSDRVEGCLIVSWAVASVFAATSRRRLRPRRTRSGESARSPRRAHPTLTQAERAGRCRSYSVSRSSRLRCGSDARVLSLRARSLPTATASAFVLCVESARCRFRQPLALGTVWIGGFVFGMVSRWFGFEGTLGGRSMPHRAVCLPRPRGARPRPSAGGREGPRPASGHYPWSVRTQAGAPARQTTTLDPRSLNSAPPPPSCPSIPPERFRGLVSSRALAHPVSARSLRDCSHPDDLRVSLFSDLVDHTPGPPIGDDLVPDLVVPLVFP